MGEQFKNVQDLINTLSEDENFKKEAIKQLSENDLGKFLSILRHQHQLTQEELANKIGCSQGRISKIESAKDISLSIKDLIDYGNALGVEIEFRTKIETEENAFKEEAFP